MKTAGAGSEVDATWVEAAPVSRGTIVPLSPTLTDQHTVSHRLWKQCIQFPVQDPNKCAYPEV